MRLGGQGSILTGLVLSPDLLTRSSGRRYESNASSDSLTSQAFSTEELPIYFDKPFGFIALFLIYATGKAGARRTRLKAGAGLCRGFSCGHFSCLPLLEARCRSLKDRMPAVAARDCKLIAGRLVEMKGCVWHAPLRWHTKALWLEPRFLISQWVPVLLP